MTNNTFVVSQRRKLIFCGNPFVNDQRDQFKRSQQFKIVEESTDLSYDRRTHLRVSNEVEDELSVNMSIVCGYEFFVGTSEWPTIFTDKRTQTENPSQGAFIIPLEHIFNDAFRIDISFLICVHFGKLLAQ